MASPSDQPASDPASPPEFDEVGCLRRAQSGDLEAYDALVLRHRVRVYNAVYHLTSNHEDANDLTQDAFIKAFRVLNTFKGDSSFGTWVT